MKLWLSCHLSLPMAVFIPFSLSYTKYVTSSSKQEISHTCSKEDGQEQPHIECHCYQHQEDQHQEVAVA